MTQPAKTNGRKVAAKKAAPAAAPTPEPTQPVAELHAVPTPEPEILPAGAVRVPLGDGSVVVPDSEDWPSSANEDFFNGFYRTWAGKILSDEDFAFWVTTDPTNRQVNQFFRDLNEARGTGNGVTLLRAASRLGIG
jgi:hypothetical protein